jgi:proteasome alpha subunit
MLKGMFYMDDMQHQQMGYDRAVTMFASDGRILQVEYAERTIRLGAASVGVVCKDCVVIVSDRRRRDKLVVGESANKINEVDEHIICVSAGISSDARVLVDKARILAQQHRVNYDTEPTTESIVRDIADVKQQFTQYGGGRPFGVSLMFAGINGEPVLYTTDITGNYLRYKANAIGEDDEKLKRVLRKDYREGLNQKDGLKLALDAFREVLGDEFDLERFDAGILRKDSKGVVIDRLSGKKLE